MRIAVGLKEIFVHVEYNSLNHRIMRQYIDKNFSNTIKLTNTILILNNEKESYKKLYFLQWLYASYKKVNPTLMPSFKSTLLKRKHMPIKIKITDKKEVLHKFNLAIKHLEKDVLVFRLDIKNFMMLNYLKLMFRKEYLKKSKDGLAFSCKIGSSESRLKLEKLLKRKKVLNYPISFLYNESWINEFIYPKSSEFAQCKLSTYEDSFATKSYEILSSTPKDTLSMVKKRYLNLVKKLHPDNVYCEDRLKVAEFTEKFQLIQRAYEVIKNDKKNILSFIS